MCVNYKDCKFESYTRYLYKNNHIFLVKKKELYKNKTFIIKL